MEAVFPKDVAALTSRGRSAGLTMPLLTAVATVNKQRADRLVDLVSKGLDGLAGRKVTVPRSRFNRTPTTSGSRRRSLSCDACSMQEPR